MSAYFISGTDTDCGKTHVTGILARRFLDEGKSVITQKLVQTGCYGISEDIIAHRRKMGIDLQPADLDSSTCPYVLKFPSSPHLAARLEDVKIDVEKIAAATRSLQKQYDMVLIEGAGGLMVPLCHDFLTIDYIAKENIALILVVPAKLGSINHALLSVEACMIRGIEIAKIVFNNFPKTDECLWSETRDFVKKYASIRYPNCEFLEI